MITLECPLHAARSTAMTQRYHPISTASGFSGERKIRWRSPRLWALILFGLAFVGIGYPTYAEAGALGSDDRRMIDQLGSPWSAIGQINVTGYRRMSWCTGSLIATNLVITAAHCLMDPWSGKPFPLHQIHFLAGVRRSSWLGHSTAKCLHFHPEYEYVSPNRIDPSQSSQDVPRRSVEHDIALLVLNEDLTRIPPLQIEHAEVQESDISLVHASYPADRRYVLTGHFGCRLLARDQNLWLTNCEAHAASSGGPVFIHRGKELKLAAVMVGLAGTAGSVAVPLSAWINIVAMSNCP